MGFTRQPKFADRNKDDSPKQKICIRKELSYAKIDAEYELKEKITSIIIDFERYKRLVEYGRDVYGMDSISCIDEFEGAKIFVSTENDILKFNK